MNSKMHLIQKIKRICLITKHLIIRQNKSFLKSSGVLEYVQISTWKKTNISQWCQNIKTEWGIMRSTIFRSVISTFKWPRLGLNWIHISQCKKSQNKDNQEMKCITSKLQAFASWLEIHDLALFYFLKLHLAMRSFKKDIWS